MSLYFFIFGAAIVIIGASFLAAVRYSRKKQAEVEETYSAWATAELVDKASHVGNFSDDMDLLYYGVYTFETQQGLLVKAESDFGYGSADEIPGPIVTIRYKPSDPLTFIIPEEQAITSSVLPVLRKIGIGLLVLGISLLIAGVVLLGK